MLMRLELPSYAKINLNLYVIGKRDDGYHEIASVFQTIDLHDSISVERSEIDSFSCDDPSLPIDSDNLAIRARDLYRELSGIDEPISINLKKQIPSPGGLGGGSSNAATVLIAMNRLFDSPIALKDLAHEGAKLGADVAFFFFGGTAFCSGIGEHVDQLDDWRQESILLTSPKVSVSTPWAYKSLAKEGLTKDYHESILKHYRNESEKLSSGDFRFENEFSDPIKKEFPLIEKAFEVLMDGHSRQVSLSGSGPSVFSLINSGDFGFFDEKLTRSGIHRNFLVKPVSAAEYFRNVLKQN